MAYVEDSDPIGIVEGNAATPISLQAWAALIASDARLRAPQPVRSVNPFNQQGLEIAPHRGTAYVWENGSAIGMMTWSEEGLDEIVVYGASPVVIALAKEIAQRLGGGFRSLDLNRPAPAQGE